MSLYVYRCPRCPHTASMVALRDTQAIPLCQGTGHMVPSERVTTEMVRVPDWDSVLLPMDSMPEGVAVSLGPMNVDTLKAAGILMPATQHALEWLYRHRATNGMAGAFCKVGGRRCIDLVAFARLMKEKRA